MIVHRSERAAAASAAQWQRIKAVRADIERGPVATALGRFQFDDISRRRMQDVLEAFSVGYVQWADADNNLVDFAPTELEALYRELVLLSGRRALDLFAYAESLRGKLPLPADHPALRGEGWPG